MSNVLVKYEGVDTPSVSEAMAENRLDFDVVTKPMIDPFTNAQSEFWGVFGVFDEAATVTKQFTTCKAKYQPINNRDLFAGIAPLVDSGDMKIRNAGYMKDGARSFILTELMKATENRIGSTNEKIMPYMLTIADHSGGSCRFKSAGVNLFCCNQIGPILRKKIDSTGIDMRICHSGDVVGKLMDANQYFNQVMEYYTEVGEAMNSLVDTKITTPQFEAMLDVVHPMKEKGKGKTRAENVHNVIRSNFYNPQNLQPEIAGTAWAAANTVTTYFTWQAFVKKANGNDDFRRLDNCWFGGANKVMGNVYKYLHSLAA